jgi:hypothetical protein
MRGWRRMCAAVAAGGEHDYARQYSS